MKKIYRKSIKYLRFISVPVCPNNNRLVGVRVPPSCQWSFTGWYRHRDFTVKNNNYSQFTVNFTGTILLYMYIVFISNCNNKLIQLNLLINNSGEREDLRLASVSNGRKRLLWHSWAALAMVLSKSSLLLRRRIARATLAAVQ